MKTLLLLVRTKLFLFGFLSICTFILANNYIQRKDFFKFTEPKEEKLINKPEKIVAAKKKASKIKMNEELQRNSFSSSINFDPSLVSDQPDYAPGTTATFTGSGFRPGETVTLLVLHYDGTSDGGADHQPWIVIADSLGNFVTTWHVCEDDCVGSTLRATADGATSGLHAEVIFTDSGSFGYATTSGKSNTVSMIPGSTDNTALGVDVDAPKNNGSFNVSLSFASTGSPSITFGTGPTQINVTSSTIGYVTTSGSGDVHSFPISVTVGSSVAPGTYSIKVIAIESTSGIADGSGWTFTVVVSAVGSGGLTVTAPTCAQGGSFTITYSPTSGPDVTETKTTPFTFTAKKNTSYSITTIASIVNGNTYTGTATVTGTTPNTNDFTQTVTLTYLDNTVPSITASGTGLSLGCNPAASDINAALGSASASDNCGSPTITTVDESITGTCSKSQTRTFKATDATGNTSTTSRTATWTDDTQAPVLNVPANATVQCDAVPSVGSATASDNCSASPTVTYLGEIRTDGSCPNSYTLTRTWKAVDACNNSSTASQTITVKDNTAPTFTAPAATTIYKDASCNYDASVGITGDVTDEADNCDNTLDATFTDAVAAGTCQGEQIITRTWVLTDDCGNSTSHTQTITVKDNTAPTFTAPAATTIYKDASCNYDASVGVTGDVTDEADNCDNTLDATFTDAVAAGTCVGEQVITRTWVLTDDCGNSTSHTQTITVKDNTAPVITGVGGPSTISCPATPSFSSPTASDACSNASLTYTDATTPGTCTNAYSKTRKWTATDACGNTSTASQTITVVDNTAPSITCTTNKSVNPNNGTPACTYKHAGNGWNATASDLCGSYTLIYNLSGATTTSNLTTLDNAIFNLGVTTVTAIATDACGNSEQCSFTVTVTSTLSATITTNNPNLYFGYSVDQNATITVYPTGGTAPYKVAITMVDPPPVSPARPVERSGGALICNYINASGDEVWTPGTNTASTTGNACGSVPVSTSNHNIPVGGNYWIKATLITDARFIATVTDANNCTYTIPYTQAARVDAEDARCFAGNSGVAKVTICHKTGSATNPCVKICVDESAVASHLAHGDFIGNCTPNCLPPVNNAQLGLVSGSASAEVTTPQLFNVKAFPNPSGDEFNVYLEGTSNEKVSLVLYDALGREVKKFEKENGNIPIHFGRELKGGIYILEVRQGNNRKAIKLIKQN